MMSCILCGSDKYTDFQREKDFCLYRCRQCGFCWSSALYLDDIDKLYTKKDYYASWGIINSDDSFVRKMKALTFEKRLQGIEKYGKIGRILDVGCATGFFLEVAQKRGWQPYGIEVNDYAWRKAQEQFAGLVQCGYFENAVYEGASFDAVVFSDLLEHLKNPLAALGKVNVILKPEGIFLITCPDIESMSAKLLAKSWPHYKKEHLYYFSPATIRRILRKTGFEVLEIRPAVKALSIQYISRQFSVYKKFFLFPFFFFLSRVLPVSLSRKPFLSTFGEMSVIAKKLKE